jgi:hypothetical protein
VVNGGLAGPRRRDGQRKILASPQHHQADRHAVLAEVAFLAVWAGAVATEPPRTGLQEDGIVIAAAHRGGDLVRGYVQVGDQVEVIHATLERPVPREMSKISFGEPGEIRHAGN